MAFIDDSHGPPNDRTIRRLSELDRTISACRACPRLVEWRERSGRTAPKALRHDRYWSKPLAGFGDPSARLLVVGLAPAANGGNRTGRMFTGDRSGDFLVGALYRAGFANIPTSTRSDDGLALDDCFITAAVRCAPPQNRPTPQERDRCAPFLSEEVALLEHVRVVLALGAFAFEAVWRLFENESGRHRAKFAHGAETPLSRDSGGSDRVLISSYHPSQRNVFTGLLSSEILDAVLARAKVLCRRA